MTHPFEQGKTPESRDNEPATQEQLQDAHNAIKDAVFRDGLAFYDQPSTTLGEQRIGDRSVPILEDQVQITVPVLNGETIINHLRRRQTEDPEGEYEKTITSLGLIPESTIELSHWAEAFTTNEADPNKPIYSPANSILTIHYDGGSTIYDVLTDERKSDTDDKLKSSKEIMTDDGIGDDLEKYAGTSSAAEKAEELASKGDMAEFLLSRSVTDPRLTESLRNEAAVGAFEGGKLAAKPPLTVAEAQAVVQVAALFGH